MEITGGKARGLNLISPEGRGTVRPTAVRARRALFDSLALSLPGCVFADLFAGSGAMGLEAASRGAASVLFFECSPQAWKILEKNCERAAAHGVEADFRVAHGSVPPFRRCELAAFPRPDFVFADPPYAASAELFGKVTSDAAFLEWARGGVLIWELPDPARSILPPGAPWRVSAVRKFGSGLFWELQCPDS